MKTSGLTAALWLAVQLLTQEVGVNFSHNRGSGVAVYSRRIPTNQVWVHCNPRDLCLSVGHDWKESGRWRRDCVGVQITNNWASSFRRTW